MKILIAISDLNAEFATVLSNSVENLGFNAKTVTTFDATERLLELSYDYEAVLIDESFSSLAGDSAIILCRQELASFYRNRGHQVLILPPDEDALRKALGLEKLGKIASPLIGESIAMRSLRKEISLYAPHAAPVYICGESGTGKELVAGELHRQSNRTGLFIPVNCSAIAEQLLESELFGHEKGSFTGADRQKKGLFEEANGGTLFLDEVGDMPASLQVKLLRVLQSGKLRRVGGTKELSVDVRIIAATHKSLSVLVQQGEFREDLYYRLNVLPIAVPSLRERQEDIPLLVAHFLAGKEINVDAIPLLTKQRWRGNIRELQAVLTRAKIYAGANTIDVRTVSSCLNKPEEIRHESEAVFTLEFNHTPTLEEVKQKYKDAIERMFPDIPKGQRADMMGVHRTTEIKQRQRQRNAALN